MSGRDDTAALVWAPPVSLGWLEIALPLWHRRWWLLLSTLLALLAAAALAFMQPVRFASRASFVVVQSVARPSQMGVANTIPALAGLIGGGTSAIDQQVAILRSDRVLDRVLQRFDLQRAWKLPTIAAARARLAKRVDVVIGRREGLVHVSVEDEHPQRAAAIANELVAELRATLLVFAIDEARQRRAFYENQLAAARDALEEARHGLQGAGFDGAALRVEPRAAAEGYARVQAEIAAAEVKLAAVRRARAEGSAEVQQQLSELQALRAQLARQTAPREPADGGGFVTRMREFRYAEAKLEGLARQAEAARVDEAAEPLPLQLLDGAVPAPWPSSPRPVVWMVVGALLALLLHSGVILARHRAALARCDPQYQLRLAQVQAVLPVRRGRRAAP
jgi:uncharacterized protein involved in exopolysaccharide biosynthesis